MRKLVLFALLLCVAVGACSQVGPEVTLAWDGEETLASHAWKGEKVSAQAFISSAEALRGVKVKVEGLRGPSVLPGGAASVSFVEYVMGDVLDPESYSQCAARVPGQYDSILVADMISLPDGTPRDVPANTVQPVWLSVKVPQDAAPGLYQGRLKVTGRNFKAKELPFEVQVVDKALPEPSQWKFHLDLWQNPYSVARYHGVELWSEEHFAKMRPVMKVLADAGQKSVTATLLDRPWNGQTYDAFGSMVVKTKHPDGSWTYDYTVFDKWVEFMEEVGIDRQINCYSLLPWAMKFDYVNAETGETEYVEAEAGTVAYKAYWAPFVADFANHLREKGWFDKTMIAMDERPMEAMKLALDVIYSVEPEFKVSLAGNYHPEIEADLYDLCIPLGATYPPGVIERRRAEGKVTTIYTCCAEREPNTFMASNPQEATWLMWRTLAVGCDGYLRWAYNSWTEDPVKDARFRSFSSGDCYLVYPDGRSSVRMEKLIEGIKDCEKARILREEWTEQGDSAKLEALDSALSLFTRDRLEQEGPAPALKAAKEVLKSL